MYQLDSAFVYQVNQEIQRAKETCAAVWKELIKAHSRVKELTSMHTRLEHLQRNLEQLLVDARGYGTEAPAPLIQ